MSDLDVHTCLSREDKRCMGGRAEQHRQHRYAGNGSSWTALVYHTCSMLSPFYCGYFWNASTNTCPWLRKAHTLGLFIGAQQLRDSKDVHVTNLLPLIIHCSVVPSIRLASRMSNGLRSRDCSFPVLALHGLARVSLRPHSRRSVGEILAAVGGGIHRKGDNSAVTRLSNISFVILPVRTLLAFAWC